MNIKAVPSGLEYRIKKIKPQFLVFLTIVSIKAIYISMLPGLTMQTGADEIGTIAGAAFFAGLDWSPIISHVPYYGFGYSLFMSPLFWLGLSTQAIHFLMLFFGAVCFGFCGIICYNILTRVFEIDNHRFCCLLAIVSTHFIDNMTFSNFVMNETPLYLINLILLYLFFIMLRRKSENKNNNLYSLLLAAVMGYGFLVHTRVIFLWGGIVVLFVVQYIINRKRLLKLKFFIPTFLSMFLLSRKLVDFVQIKLWLKGDFPLQNDLDSISNFIGDIKQLFTIGGIKKFLKVIIGHFFSMSFLSSGTILVLIFIFALATISLLYKKKKQGMIKYIKDNDKIVMATVYVVSVLFASTMLTAISSACSDIPSFSHAKWFIYTRYWAVTAMPAVMILCVILYKVKINKSIYAIIFIGTIAINTLFIRFVSPHLIGEQNSLMFYSFIFIPFKKVTDPFKAYDWLIMSFVSIVLTVFVLSLFHKKKSFAALLCIFVFFTGSNIYVTAMMRDGLSMPQSTEFANIATLFDEAAITPANYYAINTDINDASIYNLVFNMYQHRIVPQNPLVEHPAGKENKFPIFITKSLSFTPAYLNVGYQQATPDHPIYVLIFKDDEDLCRRFTEKGYELNHIDTIFIWATELHYVTESRLVESGPQWLAPGDVQYGPYIYLEKGRYYIKIYGENLDTCQFSSCHYSEEGITWYELNNLITSPREVSYEINITFPAEAEFLTSVMDTEAAVEGIYIEMLSE